MSFLFIICFSILFTQLIEPLQKFKMNNDLFIITGDTSFLRGCIIKLLNCSKCFSFWFSLILLQSFFISVIVAVLTEIGTKIYNKL